MNKKILLVGGTGYLGAHLGAALSGAYEVNITGTKANSENNYYQVNFNDKNTFNALINQKFDLVVVLAASISGLGVTDLTNADLYINTVQLGAFLQFIVDKDITEKILFISSMTVYSIPEKVPVNENSLLKPINVYGLSKMIGENLASFLTNHKKMKVLMLRLPGIYGGNRKSGYIFNTICKALNNEPINLDTTNLGYWECIEINDLCQILHQLIAVYTWEKQCEIINVGYGEKTDFVDTAKFIVKQLNSRSVITTNGSYADLYMSNKKLNAIVNVRNHYYESLNAYIKSITNALCNS